MLPTFYALNQGSYGPIDHFMNISMWPKVDHMIDGEHAKRRDGGTISNYQQLQAIYNSNHIYQPNLYKDFGSLTWLLSRQHLKLQFLHSTSISKYEHQPVKSESSLAVETERHPTDFLHIEIEI